MLLIIGYGNPLRTDDGIGPEIACALLPRFPADMTEVITAHQLTPELAEPISRASMAVFIDSSEGTKPGAIIGTIVTPQAGSGAFTHNVTPASLLGASHDLYGTTPIGLLITITGESFEYGAALSATLSALVPSIIVQVSVLIASTKGIFNA